MTDKEKIREELARMMYGYNLEGDIASCENAEGEKLADIKYQLCKKILERIDSLQEEPDLNWKEMSLQEKKDLITSLQKDVEEPVGKDLEKAAATYTQDWFCQCPEECENAFKAGAQWQKQKNESKVLTEKQCRKIRDDAFEQGKAEGHNEANREFTTGVWFAIDHLVRYEDMPSMAIEIANAAGISRKQARHLWKNSDLEGCDGNNRMTWFLDNEKFCKE